MEVHARRNSWWQTKNSTNRFISSMESSRIPQRGTSLPIDKPCIYLIRHQPTLNVSSIDPSNYYDPIRKQETAGLHCSAVPNPNVLFIDRESIGSGVCRSRILRNNDDSGSAAATSKSFRDNSSSNASSDTPKTNNKQAVDAVDLHPPQTTRCVRSGTTSTSSVPRRHTRTRTYTEHGRPLDGTGRVPNGTYLWSIARTAKQCHT